MPLEGIPPYTALPPETADPALEMVQERLEVKMSTDRQVPAPGAESGGLGGLRVNSDPSRRGTVEPQIGEGKCAFRKKSWGKG